ncbi:MAG TPA: discoidin domain-containing protein [Firmicutes bacterium]|nr:discoidin domain-containing protein [Bacillota bacterium]
MRKFVSVFLAVALVAVACCVFASAEDTNLALGKSYTTVGIYTEEGAAAPQYPDEENKSLTDGQKAAAETGYGDAAWVGFNRMDATMQTNGSIGIITVDLGAASSVSGFAIEVFEDSAAGITFPSKVEFFYSTDNETWTSAGEGTKSGEGSVAEFALTLDSAVNASYVKVEMTCGASNWVFVSEFEAFGTAGSGGTDESEAVSEAESETASSAAPAESSTAASSAGTSSTPSTSDAGIVAVVVLAVVAVIGAAVVVKKRA